MKPVFHTSQLENGLKLHTLNRADIPLIGAVFLYRVGSSHEIPAEFGMAHFLEHMMFKGSKSYPQGSLDLFSLRHGGENNAFTCRDFTAFYHLLPSESWREVLRIEKDRMCELHLRSGDFNSEKNVVLEELYMYEDDPFEALYDQHYKLGFPDEHPYSHPIIGTVDSLEAMTIDQMQCFYSKFYQPANCEVILVGDLGNENDLQEEFEGLFSPIAGLKVNAQLRNAPSQKPGFQSFSLGMDVESTRLSLSFPTHRSEEKRDAVADMIEELLTGGRTSRLVEILHEQHELVGQIDAFQDSNRLGGRFILAMELRKKGQVSQIYKILNEELEKLRNEPVGEEELSRVKKKVLASHYLEQERTEDFLYQLAQYADCLGFEEYLSGYPRKVEDVSAQDILDYSREYFSKEQTILGYAYPEGQSPGDLEI